MSETMTRPDPAHDNAHDLMPAWLAATIPPLYAQEGKAEEAVVGAKFFTPDSSWTWYVCELDPQERLCFGLVDGFEEELGYFALEELEAARGPLGLRIERDLWWRPVPLSAVRAGEVR